MTESEPAEFHPLLLRQLGEDGCRRLLAEAQARLRTGDAAVGSAPIEQVRAMIAERLAAG